MKKTTADILTKSPFASLRAAETAYLNRTPTPIQQAAYRLATIAAPFAAAGASQEAAIHSAQKLMLACQRRLTSDAKVAAVLAFENPDLANGAYFENCNIYELRKEIHATDKTLKSYVLEAYMMFDDDGKCHGPRFDEDGESIGEQVWQRLLAGEPAITPEILEVMKTLRAKRFAESRKKAKKRVK